MKKKQPKAKSKRAVKPAKKARSAKKAAKKPAPKQAKKPPEKAAKKPAPKKAAKKPGKKTKDWMKFVEEHGVVLASARGPVPSVAEAIAGEPIVGSWWSHSKGQLIYDALSSIELGEVVLCFKLVDNKVTFVHRRLWPALAKLADAGVINRERAASIEQEHMPSGEHRNITTAYPDWVPEDVVAAATSLSIDDAKRQLGSWV